MSKGKLFIILYFFILISQVSFSQKNYSYGTIEYEYKRALELYQKEKYGAAQPHFLKIIEKMDGFESEITTNSSYYAAMCSVHLFNEDAEFLLNEFISNHPESMKTRKAIWELALFLYKTKKYTRAIVYFEQVDKGILTEDEQFEYYFKKGYSYFARKKYDKASQSFYEIKDKPSDYYGPANYYYAYIAYKNENYETALIGFKRLQDDENFKGIVPYYILQILYGQKKYDEIVKYGPGLLENAIPGREAEVAKFVGDAYYQLENYEEARKYLGLYAEKSKSISREDRYELGYVNYMLEDYEKAIPYFVGMGGVKDLLGQNAYYLLADCYLKTDNKGKAGQAFYTASDMDFDPDIKEDAMFNYAKITYELSFSPFNEAIKVFQKYIELYPGSDKIEEAYNYLVMSYLNTKNYKLALESINKIQNKNNKIKKAYQRIAFYRGLELFGDLRFESALDLFDTAIEQGNFDQEILAKSYYWKGEALYRLKNYRAAIESYNEFLVSPGAYSLKIFKLAHYNIAYCYFDLKQYTEASRWFRKFLDQTGGYKGELVANTYNRLGDCAFVNSDYPLSVNYYQKSINLKASNPAYALFQKSFALGLTKKYREEINGYTQLQKEYPSSDFLDDAIYERGRSYIKIKQNRKALDDFYKLLEQFPNSSYYAKALLQIGLVFYNSDQNEKAIETYKKVIEKFPGSPESRSALTGLKTVYVDMNEVDAYFSYVRTLGGSFANVSVSEQDSLTYLSGENLYMAGNCERALVVLGNYLQKFPEGSFVLNAHFYRAECLASSGNIQEALKDYNYVVKQSKNVFSEPSLLAVSDINYNSGNFADALDAYVMLENVADAGAGKLTARLGQMRCLYKLGNFNSVIESGQKVLDSENVTEEMKREAHFKMAKSLYKSGKFNEALVHFEKVSNEIKSEEGAESKYRIAEIYFRQGKTDESEKVVKEFVDENTPHQQWMARIFILSSDISLKKNDLLQARYTLQSLIDYYEVNDDGIKEEAKKKLNAILEMEKKSLEKDTPAPDTIFNSQKKNEPLSYNGSLDTHSENYAFNKIVS
jgi:tetratricopeptide (TPR) repeat protein